MNAGRLILRRAALADRLSTWRGQWMRHKSWIMLLVFVCLFLTCSEKKDVSEHGVKGITMTHIEVSNTVQEDPDIEAIIKPYRERLGSEMKRVIGVAKRDLLKESPEGLLGNLVADIMLEASSSCTEVDCAILNAGGIRVPIFQGEITIEQIFNLMPFENQIVVIQLSGSDLEDIVHKIATAGGAFISRMKIMPKDNSIHAVIGDKPLSKDKEYAVATLDYLTKRGGSWDALGKGKLLQATGIRLRDAIITYIAKHKFIDGEQERRIQFMQPKDDKAKEKK